MALAPFAVPSVASAHSTLPVQTVQGFGLDKAIAQGGVITASMVREADAVAQALKSHKDAGPYNNYPEFTEEVVQTAKDRAYTLSKIYINAVSNDPDLNSLQTILATVQRIDAAVQSLAASQARIEARSDNATIVKRNRLELPNNTGSTAYAARHKQVAGDGLALATALAPPNVAIPALQGNPEVGDVMTPTIDVYTLDSAAILTLIRFHNEDFGIYLQDAVHNRAQKVANWLTQPMF
ncbi:hypothetical protein C8F01DRAFT_1098681 [Mycena amicta]|nr:hypothetical protein C8F01DRAFT_1098681 [Mycena amicta]